MPAVKNKIKLCETSLSDFSIEQIEGVPFYSRYPEMERLFRKLVPSVDFGRCFAQPYENKAKRLIEWYYTPGTESPTRLSEMVDDGTALYNAVASQRDAVINAIQLAMKSAGENERKFLSAVMTGIGSADSDSTTYSYDGNILFGVWGMRAKQGRKIDDVIREDVLDHRVFRVNYTIDGDGSLSFSSMGRKYGHRLTPTEVPVVRPADGWKFIKWEPEIPHGWTVTKDMSFVAVCVEDPSWKPREGATEIPPEKIKDKKTTSEPTPDGLDEAKFHVLFKNENGGSLQGDTEYLKSDGEEVPASEVPAVVPDEGYEFIGWEPQPDGHVVHSDVEFVAKFRQIDKTFNVHFVSEDGGHLEGCTEYTKRDGEKILTNEIPTAVPEEGFEFIGWDHQPDDFMVHEDTKFVARFREKHDSWWGHLWGWGSGCLSWLLALLLLGLIGLLLWYLLSGYQDFNFCGCDCERTTVVDTISPTTDTVHEGDDLPKPTENCGVHFSGWYLSDKDEYPWVDCSRIFEDDEFGDYVGQGLYPNNNKILPNSMEHSFDAVAVSRGTHLIIYSEPNFKGREVLNVKGPILIENVVAKNAYGKLMTYTFDDSLQELFPPERRQWSSENMNQWANGSCKIICEQCKEK